MTSSHTRAIAGWASGHVEELLTAFALPLVLITAAPAGHRPTGWDLLLAGITWLPLIVRVRRPIPVAAIVVVLDAVHLIVANHGTTSTGTLPTATILALYTVGARCPTRPAWSCGLTAAVAQYVTALVVVSNHPGEDLLYLNWAMVGTVVGRLVRERRERISTAEARAELAEQTTTAEARRQVTEERLRIARELHDVLAHHITVVNAQAGVAQYLLKADPDAAEKALTGITENTRAALDELRSTLGLLRSDTAATDPTQRVPTPHVHQLPDLIDEFTLAGADIHHSTTGTAFPLTTPADLALYRIAQEALTNAAKHAPGARVDLDLCWTDDNVTLTVTNGTPDHLPASGDGTQHGLIGMHERATAARGAVSAAPLVDGGYQVVATLPRTPAPASGEPT